MKDTLLVKLKDFFDTSLWINQQTKDNLNFLEFVSQGPCKKIDKQQSVLYPRLQKVNP